jgi:serine phosphatase RsbU (regulator of sigma subunit)
MTDGLSEMFNGSGEFLTFDRLAAGLAGLDIGGQAAENILKRVVEIGHTWAAGEPIYDDVTLVVMRVKEG